MVIVAGVLVLRPGTFQILEPDMLKMIAASRAELGCQAYSYAVDVVEPAVIRVYEEWETRGHLEAHFRTPHLQAWRRRLGEVGIVGREITAWEAAAPSSV